MSAERNSTFLFLLKFPEEFPSSMSFWNLSFCYPVTFIFTFISTSQMVPLLCSVLIGQYPQKGVLIIVNFSLTLENRRGFTSKKS
jgi:hypothetical protein